ncbi:hypothetical protein BASA50_011370 [Batrachochytrium salamandrivorans]|uniref:Uncharacterized protein n=1 Tax=Batrachochytrium salamandrivorans TaxID=1357716 RepID=A0ABQ8EVP9_9FUNG|nr:hypothetical protein BASA50_011370 [Batrachochytrium salamandrivorans]
MKPTATIAVLCLVVAGASAMNPALNQQSGFPDAADSSQSSRRTSLRYTWNKKTKGPQSPDVQVKRRMSSKMKQSHHQTPHEEQQSTESPLDEKSDASPSMTYEPQEIPYTYSSSTSLDNEDEGLSSMSKLERERKARSLQARLLFSHQEYILTGKAYSSAYSRINPTRRRNPANLALIKNECAQFEMAAYIYKASLHELSLSKRKMNVGFRKELKRKTSKTVPDKIPKRPVLEEQNCEKLRVELDKLIKKNGSLDPTKKNLISELTFDY